MKKQHEDLRELFLDQLGDMLSSEQQIIKSLPGLITLASSEELKKGLTEHLKETKAQVTRLKNIFAMLSLKAKAIPCPAMKGLIQEAHELVKGRLKSPTLDAAIICAAQKIEHYEMATYGTLRSFAKKLNLDSKVASLLQETLNEEGNADKTLTKIADGFLFTTGVNRLAASGKALPKRKKAAPKKRKK